MKQRNVTAIYIGFHADPNLRYMNVTVHRDKEDEDGFACNNYNDPTPSSVVRIIRTLADQRVKIAQEQS